METSESFKKALKFTLQWEGGYSNHPYDKGGPTNKGITQRTYDAYCKSKLKTNRPVKMIKDFEVEDIYYNDYWLRSSCNIYPIDIAIALFDWSVNSGINCAARNLKLSGLDINAFLDRRESFFRIIGTGKNSVFLKGWLNRLNSLRSYIQGIDKE